MYHCYCTSFFFQHIPKSAKESKMKTRKPGNIEVSEIGMGCMAFSHRYGAIASREYAMEAIHKLKKFVDERNGSLLIKSMSLDDLKSIL